MLLARAPGCYGHRLLIIVLLYENTPGLIWGYHYVNFLVFTYVSNCFSRLWAHVQYRRSQWLMGALLKHSRLVYCTGDCVQYMEMPLVDGRHTLHSVLYMVMPHRSYLYIRQLVCADQAPGLIYFPITAYFHIITLLSASLKL
jgi:hypothetical protein